MSSIILITLINEFVSAHESFSRAGVVGLEDELHAVMYSGNLSRQFTATYPLLQLHPPQPVHREHVHIVKQTPTRVHQCLVTSHCHIFRLLVLSSEYQNSNIF